ncbi:Kelch repeat-containing protein [Thermaurantiacus sp.]
MRRRDMVAATLGMVAAPALAQWTPEPTRTPSGRPPAAPPRFRALVPLPRPLQEIYPTVFDARIIVAGGLEARGAEVKSLADLAPTRAVWSFRPGARQWDALPDLPIPLHHPFLVGYQRGLWAIGGFTGAPGRMWQMERRTWILPRLGAAWLEGPPLPRPQAEVVGGVVGGRLVIAGGRTPMEAANASYSDHGDTQDMWILKADGSGWEAGPRLPRGVNSAAADVANGRLHMVGGRYSTGGQIINVDAHQIYDPSSNSWRMGPALPAPRGGLAAAFAAGRLFAIGGESFGKTPAVHADIFRFDPRSQSWDRVTELPTPLHGLGAVAVAGRVHVIGGASEPGGRGTTRTHLMFTP